MTASGLRKALVFFLAVVGLLSVLPPIPAILKEHLRAIAFFNMPRPRPTGEFAVGVTSLVSPSGESVDVWYPTDRSRLRFADHIGALLQRLVRPTQAIAFRDVAPAVGAPRPLVILVPSWFSRRNESSFTLANLASHGFAVAAVDDFLHGEKLSGEDRTAQLSSLDFSSASHFAASRQIAQRRAVLGGRAVAATIDAVVADPKLGPLVDGARVGVLGFSFGGSIAAAMSREAGRVAAVVSLDGDVFDVERWPPAVPYLFLSSDVPFPSQADLGSQDLRLRFESVNTCETYGVHLRPSMPQDSLSLMVANTRHIDFTDRLVMPAFDELWNKRAIDRQRIWADVNQVIVSFLEVHLRQPDGIRGRVAVPPLTFADLPRPSQPSDCSSAPTASANVGTLR